MSFNPNTAPSPWRRPDPLIRAEVLPKTAAIDFVRLVRLAILVFLVGFWTAVLMAIF